MYCQKCRTPLKADSSLNDLNPAAFDLLVGTVTRSDRKPAQRPHVTHPRERQALYAKVSNKTQSPLHKRTIPTPRDDLQELSGHAGGHPGMSFVEITESQIVSPETIQYPIDNGRKTQSSTDPNTAVATSSVAQYDVEQQLFAILSAHSDIDHPVCNECSSLLLVAHNAKLAAATREHDAYATFLKQLQHSSANQKDQEPSAERELLALKKEEDAALAELEALEQQKRVLEAELADLEDENRELEKEEELFWTSRNTFAEQQHDLETDLASLQQKYSHDQKQLERLQRTNVYNDTFYISHDGYFGTINGLRLGRLPNQNVEWAEINAAWGQTLLLLQTIAERLNFTFQGYRLRPLGSTSRIEKLEYPQQGPSSISNPTASNAAQATVPAAKITHLDMYSSGEIALGRVFNHRRFDQGMVAFLDCLKQLGTHVENSSAVVPNRETPRPPLTRNTTAATNVTANNNSNQPIRLPYAIDGDKIASRDRPDDAVSIKLGVGFSQDENFTKACKYTLTCCKYLLAHVSNLEGSRTV